MAWKTPNGRVLSENDRVVWLEDGLPDWRWTGAVVDCLPFNDDDDGEIRIKWDDGDGPKPDRNWCYPFQVELIESLNVLDRIVGQE